MEVRLLNTSTENGYMWPQYRCCRSQYGSRLLRVLIISSFKVLKIGTLERDPEKGESGIKNGFFLALVEISKNRRPEGARRAPDLSVREHGLHVSIRAVS